MACFAGFQETGSQDQPGAAGPTTMGYVQVAAQAFVYLLQHLPAEDSGLFARELVAQHVVCSKCLFTT